MVDTREILNHLFSKTNSEQKKLLNNWCRSTHGKPLQLWTRQVGLESTDLKRFLVEVDKALESSDWSYFLPQSDDFVEVKAPAVDQVPEPKEEPAPCEVPESEYVEVEAKVPEPEPEHVEVKAEQVTAPKIEVTSDAVDPLQGLIQYLEGRVQAPAINEEMIAEVVRAEVRKQMQSILSSIEHILR